jgi:hypothetical protein
MKFDKQIERFVIKFVFGAVILAGLSIGAFAYGEQVVRGHGIGQGLSDALRSAKEDAAGQCAAHKGVENVIITKQECTANESTCEVEIEATCKEKE